MSPCRDWLSGAGVSAWARGCPSNGFITYLDQRIVQRMRPCLNFLLGKRNGGLKPSASDSKAAIRYTKAKVDAGAVIPLAIWVLSLRQLGTMPLRAAVSVSC
jgi:hypothetical protein